LKEQVENEIRAAGVEQQPPPPPAPGPAPVTEKPSPPPPAPDLSNAPEAILNAWTALEALSPQTFRRPEEMASGDRNAVASHIPHHLILHCPRSILQSRGQPLGGNLRIGAKDFLARPSAREKLQNKLHTLIRVPLTQGLPPRTPGLTTIQLFTLSPIVSLLPECRLYRIHLREVLPYRAT
jgi:hypothetical protein